MLAADRRGCIPLARASFAFWDCHVSLLFASGAAAAAQRARGRPQGRPWARERPQSAHKSAQDGRVPLGPKTGKILRVPYGTSAESRPGSVCSLCCSVTGRSRGARRCGGGSGTRTRSRFSARSCGSTRLDRGAPPPPAGGGLRRRSADQDQSRHYTAGGCREHGRPSARCAACARISNGAGSRTPRRASGSST